MRAGGVGPLEDLVRLGSVPASWHRCCDDWSWTGRPSWSAAGRARVRPRCWRHCSGSYRPRNVIVLVEDVGELAPDHPHIVGSRPAPPTSRAGAGRTGPARPAVAADAARPDRRGRMRGPGGAGPARRPQHRSRGWLRDRPRQRAARRPRPSGGARRARRARSSRRRAAGRGRAARRRPRRTPRGAAPRSVRSGPSSAAPRGHRGAAVVGKDQPVPGPTSPGWAASPPPAGRDACSGGGGGPPGRRRTRLAGSGARGRRQVRGRRPGSPFARRTGGRRCTG